MALYFWVEPTLAVPIFFFFFFCAWVSHVMRFRKCVLEPKLQGYLPGTKGYVIYSPDIAPSAMYVKLFLFRFSIVMQEQIAFS